MQLRYLFLLTLLLGASLPAFSQTESDRPLITVTGQAEVLAVPDEVVFNLTASTVDKDLLNAQRRNDEVVKKVLDLARQYQVPPINVQTGHIRLEERYSDEEATRKPRVFLGYAVTKGIAIILRDVTRAEALLSDIFKSGITRIDGVEFRTTQNRKLRDQARAMAIKAAQEKASALAREIGQSIGKAHTIVEQGQERRGYAANTTFGVVGTSSDEEETIALGQISISARVVVSFELK